MRPLQDDQDLHGDERDSTPLAILDQPLRVALVYHLDLIAVHVAYQNCGDRVKISADVRVMVANRMSCRWFQK